jgi:HEPN domain-containing protein
MPVLNDVYEIIDAIKDDKAIDAVVLFGSIVREGKGNDIDMLIVSSDIDNTQKKLNPFYKKFAIDAIIVSREKLHESFFKGNPFLRLIQKEGKVIYMKDSLTESKNIADEDLRQGKYLMEGEFYRGACLHFQQSIEKIIKWALLKNGWELEKIHNIRVLLMKLRQFNLMVKLQEEDISFIDSIYRGRYPGEEGLLPLGNPTADDALKAFKIANKVFDELEKQIGQ